MSLQNAQSDGRDWLDEAKGVLHEWGAEERRQRNAHGYHHETLEYIAMRYGGEAPKGGGFKAEPEKPAIVAADAIISAMSESPNGELKRAALYLYYVYRFSMLNGARVLRVNKSYFQSLIESGQDMVAGGLVLENSYSTKTPRLVKV